MKLIQQTGSIRRQLATIAVFLLLAVLLQFLPDANRMSARDQIVERAEILTEDSTRLMDQGLVKMGSQHVTLRILSGKHRGVKAAGVNELRGNMELDKIFRPGDTAEVIVPTVKDLKDAEPLIARNHYRFNWTLLLFMLFALLLLLFGSWTGLKALLSFIISCQIIWKVVIPLTLRGWHASPVIFLSICLLTVIIVYLVAGWTKKGIASFIGSMSGILIGLLLSHLFTAVLKINGSMLPYAQILLGSGFEFLDLSDLFVGAIMLSASGAVMDLSMDISAGIEELHRHNPELPVRKLIAAGLRMGRSVVGTMTTTLLLAYSGGYITMMMIFQVQGNSPAEMLNNPLVAAEVVKTLVGSFALVTVAPLTAVTAGVLFAAKKNQK